MLLIIERVCRPRKRPAWNLLDSDYADKIRPNGNYEKPVNIELVYALPEQQHLLNVQVETGTTARQVVLLSGFDEKYPEVDLAQIPIGIFGERVPDDQILEEGDRVELYRPLQIDPMEARRRRAGDNP